MSLTKDQKDYCLTIYAALALYDGEAEINADQIKALLTATGNEVEAYWPILYAKFLKGKVDELIFNVGGGGGGGGGGDAGAGAGDAAPAEEEKKEEEEEEEEIDMGGGMDMFGDGGGGDDY